MREDYRIFLDSKAGLISGTLKLSNHEGITSGEMELGNFPLVLSNVEFDGKKRSFQGTLGLEDKTLEFRAEGELEDDVLDVMLRAADKQMLITGFLQTE
ncbi:MAG: hypothetical protein Q4F79_03910 [Eubacteriales bacterium]|nr:hypothetical protein [Eubacteriales bacterium]